MFDLLELIALYGDIPSSSNWATGKSGQIKQATKLDYDSMTTAVQQAVVVKSCYFFPSI